jgi:hypothetical protein
MSTVINADYWELMRESMQKMQSSPSEFYVDPAAVDRHLASLSKELQAWAKGVLQGVTDATNQRKLTAEQVLTKAMTALAEADRQQFLLTNLLEGLKRGERPSKMIENYNDIGLTNLQIEPPAYRGVMPSSRPVDPQHAPIKPAGLIRTMLDALASMCAQLIKIAIVAARAISDRVKIKFKPVVGASGFLPSLHFLVDPELELEVKLGGCFEGLEAVLDRFRGSSF